jgi:hypothetical protein
LLAQALNESKAQPWVAHTTGAGEVIEGLFRHYAADQAINLTLSHIGAMQRDYGFTIFPEAWDSTGAALISLNNRPATIHATRGDPD